MDPESAASTVGLAGIYHSKGEIDQAINILENFLSKYESGYEKKPTVEGRMVAQNDTIVLRDKEKNLIVGSESMIIVTDDKPGSGPPSQEDLQKHSDKLEQTKNTAHAYSMLAELYEKRGEFEKALKMVGNSIKIDPSDVHGIGVRGKIKSSMEDYAGAIEDLSIAIRTTPTFPNYYFDRGIVYLLLNRDDEAQKDFDAFLKIASSPGARVRLEKEIEQAKLKRNQTQ